MTTPTIRTATASHVDPVIAVVVLAFSADPSLRWALPDPRQYLLHSPSLIRALAGKAFAHHSAYYIEGYVGAALWLPPEVGPDEDTLVSLVQRNLAASLQQDAFAVLEQTLRYHPSEPHWYLPFIGVDPRHHGQGYGSALLKHGLVPCDGDKMSAYLETANRKNISLYERHGFELLGTIQVGTWPPIFPMLRKPQCG
jgi:ribosomal protein S18 acetylase RimI-like enzyme